jgi:DNA-binding Lrp family transcriptional regulator
LPTAYVLINMELFNPEIMKVLREINGVEEAYTLYGVYDAIARTRADTMDKLKQIHDKIRKLAGVRQTLTMISHED